MADNGRQCLRANLFLSFLLASFLGRYLPGCLAQLACVGEEGDDDAGGNRTAVYIVHVRKPERMIHAGPEELAAWHRSFLPSLDSGEPRLVFSYSKSMSGFAARLTPEEVEAMAGKEGFLSALPDEKLYPQTTYTPDFLRLRPDVWRAANRGEGVIIGVIDSGINPEHVSFAGSKGVRRWPPRKWRGYCEFYRHRTCGRKLLGARNYDAGAKAEQPLPYDIEGHGTHVAATAAGGEIRGANVYGYANGTASGAAPGAHLAVYKAATVAEVLAAINQAIEDGVDVLCIPLASQEADLPIFLDVVAIGTLAAVRKGILVVAAAGNYGPLAGTLRNGAPWIMTVGASTTDRALRASLRLSNGVELPGEALHRNDSSQLLDELPLTYPTAKRGQLPAEACSHLRAAKVTGKVVLCHTGANMTTAEKAKIVMAAGGVAMVVMNSEKRGQTIAEVPDLDIPTIVLDYNTSLRLREYVAKSPRLKATVIPAGTTFGNRPAPTVASFSSRGPSAANGGILKPDILAPGVNILAASHAAQSGFSIASGTSVAAAHIAGIAAILNKTNPSWNPSMIRSAIMTTSRLGDMTGVGPITDEKGTAASLFATGAGHVDPWGAADPGLAYSVEFGDYVRYLCGLGYSDVQVSVTAGFPVQCAAVGKLDAEQLNYPSIAVKLNSSATAPKAVGRTLTSVRCSIGTYKASVELPAGVAAKVSPRRLLFLRKGQRRRFAVTFSIANSTLVEAGDVIEGRLRWSSDVNVVTSPLLVTIA
ncbi:hypothetical protein Taro_003394 [Colocasia esculenta]|uniref:Uncharacterized protein n=1 Tax=Colocasia esculenta TaxID=4460 RepID=A0A843TRP4_COLES|nr:hypothetical protein [Colocasia esculenta]